MPPVGTGKKLKSEEVALLKRSGIYSFVASLSNNAMPASNTHLAPR
jgi:hypothetical protein